MALGYSGPQEPSQKVDIYIYIYIYIYTERWLLLGPEWAPGTSQVTSLWAVCLIPPNPPKGMCSRAASHYAMGSTGT